MPNHFHLATWPREDGELSRWMHWLMTTHVRLHLYVHSSTSSVSNCVIRTDWLEKVGNDLKFATHRLDIAS